MPRPSTRILLSAVLFVLSLPALQARRAAFITEVDPGIPGAHGLAKLKQALEANGVEVADGAAAANPDFAVLANVPSRCSGVPQTAEALSVRRGVHQGRPVSFCAAPTAEG
jgi:hypothetical protein